MLKRRDFLTGIAAAGLATTMARGQAGWPQKPVTIVVPFGPGGSADLVARIFAQHFQAQHGVSVVIENKGGAGGSIGTGMVAKAPSDGYTLLIGTVSTHAINPSLYAKLPYDVERDFAPISPLVRLPNLLVVGNKLPVRSVPELSLCEGQPGQDQLRLRRQRHVLASLRGHVHARDRQHHDPCAVPRDHG